MDHQTIGDIITSNMHRRCLHEQRRCVADLSRTFLAFGVHRRMFADSVSPVVFGVETSGENFNACIEIFLDVPITRVRPRSFPEPLVHGGAALAIAKCAHRESIERFKKPRGTVAMT